MERVDDASSDVRLGVLFDGLGYAGRQTFFTKASLDDGQWAPHAIRQAIETIGIDGVFGLEDGFGPPRTVKPIVYVARADSEERFDELRRDVWSQSSAPFLLVLTPETVEACSGFEPPGTASHSTAFGLAGDFPEALLNYSARRLVSSVTWPDFDIRHETNVDTGLVRSIGALNAYARSAFPSLASRHDLINALIGKFIYIYVLVDRGILSREWLSSKLDSSAPGDGELFLDALFGARPGDAGSDRWSAAGAFAVFDVVDQAINGSVFKLSREERSALPDELLRLVHGVVRSGQRIERGNVQLSFLNVSFRVLRTETISAIYESFVAVEGVEGKRADGVFYTPSHLADHVLDRAEAIDPFTESSRILDPAAGSGIFLVGAYRRLMERHRPAGGWTPQHIGRARELLQGSIFGIEKHAPAVDVCRFSLYLTLLEYVGRATAQQLVDAAGHEKFLPDLGANVVVGDAFAADASHDFSHVIGNPPWAAAGGQKDRTNRTALARPESAAVGAFLKSLGGDRVPVGQNRLSALFFWLAQRRFAKDGGTIAMVLPAHSLVGRLAGPFSHEIARRTTVRWVGNLAHLRRKLFPGAEAPACVVVASNRPPTAGDRVGVYRPLLASLPIGRKQEVWALLASDPDVQHQRSIDLQLGENGWFLQAMLSGFDRRMHEALRTWGAAGRLTLGDFLERSTLEMSKGGSPRETGIPRAEGKSDREQIHHLRPGDQARIAPAFRGYFAGNVILIPRSMGPAKYYDSAVAYPSTFNAVVLEEQSAMGRERVLGPADIVRLDPRFVAGFLAYLNSEMFRYFASLFGARYLIDKQRLEKNDLLAFPCPFEDMADPRLHAVASSESPDRSILDAMDAGSDFTEAFEEFADYRKGFANARIPPDSFFPADASARAVYLKRLQDELVSLRGGTGIIAEIGSTDDGLDLISVRFGSGTGPHRSPPLRPERYLSTSAVVYDRDAEMGFISKSPTRCSWTLDQAVSDAVALGRSMRGED